jgi:hypothetical protein
MIDTPPLIIADICESINAPMINTTANEMAKLTKEDSIKNTLTKDKTIMPTIAKNIMPPFHLLWY